VNVVCFPVDREVAFVRETARQVMRRHGRLADKFWRTEINRLYARLQVCGLAEPEIRVQIDRFAHAVYAEIHRGRVTSYPYDGDAA
jgi:hypothetical protein